MRAFVLAATLLIAGCHGSHHGGDDPEPINTLPSYLGAITSASYDGNTDDLLTAGMGKTGLAAATAPAYADPNNPTARCTART